MQWRNADLLTSNRKSAFLLLQASVALCGLAHYMGSIHVLTQCKLHIFTPQMLKV